MYMYVLFIRKYSIHMSTFVLFIKTYVCELCVYIVCFIHMNYNYISMYPHLLFRTKCGFICMYIVLLLFYEKAFNRIEAGVIWRDKQNVTLQISLTGLVLKVPTHWKPCESCRPLWSRRPQASKGPGDPDAPAWPRSTCSALGSGDETWRSMKSFIDHINIRAWEPPIRYWRIDGRFYCCNGFYSSNNYFSQLFFPYIPDFL